MQSFLRVAPALPAPAGPQPDAILLVDNSRSFAAMVSTSIRERLGLPVTVAASLAEAKAALAGTDRHFLVLTGLVLADAGPDAILAEFVATGLPIVVVSGVYDEAMRQKLLAQPIVDCVLKDAPGNVDYLVWLAQRLDRNRRIGALVVDDSPAARSLAASRLKLYGFKVAQAANAAEALQAVAADPGIRLVITDYEMPGMNGLALIRQLRRTHARDRMAIIGVSGSDSAPLVAQFLKHGANDFLQKPCSGEEFFCRVSQNVDNLDLIGTLQDLATRDFLTGLPNRRHFFDLGAKLFHASPARGLAAAMIDIDHFKHINDTWGHDAGDLAIKAVANAVAQHVRERDLPARFGGEEFVVLAPGLAKDEVPAYFEALRARIEGLAIPLGNGREVRLTVSIGVCAHGDSLSAMLSEADRQLYVAKACGRNRVKLAAVQPEGAHAVA